MYGTPLDYILRYFEAAISLEFKLVVNDKT